MREVSCGCNSGWNETSDVTAVGRIVDMAADVDIIGRVDLRGGGIVDGMDNTVED